MEPRIARISQIFIYKIEIAVGYIYPVASAARLLNGLADKDRAGKAHPNIVLKVKELN